MARATMVNGTDNIRQQAQQGSMAAIIQLLNEQLADQGVRTRAVFAEGALQLLCEAAIPEQLDASFLVPRVQQLLEMIAPRNVRRVNVLARIVQEQQLLWFDAISRDPDNQLLWSQEITLKKPNFIEQLTKKQSPERVISLTKPQELPKVPVGTRPNRYQQSFWKGTLGGVSLMGLILVGWHLYQQSQSTQLPQSTAQPPSPAIVSPSPNPSQSVKPADPFAEAVRLAEQAAMGGKNAETRAQWLALASQWEKASDLMSQVPSTDPRYITAQDRVITYRQNSQAAQAQANN